MKETLEYINEKTENFEPEIGVILGSGLNYFADDVLEKQYVLPYRDIPEFPQSTAPGHKGNLVFGTLEEKKVVCLQGRFHYYEGYPMQHLTFPVRVLGKLGIKTLLLTNAAGGITEDKNPGTLMLITDHINLMGTNPLIGKHDPEHGVRFPDMTTTYHPALQKHALKTAAKLGIDLKTGVYLAVSGPSYETPAEIRAFRTLGADAVGMSTIPEAIVANQMGIRVMGISCISNKAAGITGNPLTEEEVLETGNRVKLVFSNLIEEIIWSMPV